LIYLVRRVWKEYIPIVDAIVFIIDVSKKDRFQEAYAELYALLNFEDIENCPILILGNKIDKYDAVGEDELKMIFNLNGILTGKVL
jgi:GTP-binding protein SAR1